MANPKEKAAATAATKTLSADEKLGISVRLCEGCNPHEYQDQKYGLNKRMKNFSKTKGWGCTVCARYEQSIAKK